MNLYMDVGNSRVRLVTGDGEFANVKACCYSPETLAALLHEYAGEIERPDRVVVANVAGATVAGILTEQCLSLWSLTPEFLVSTRSVCGVTNAYADPARLGVDRWLALVAGWNKYRENVCVIDCGSAVTADLVRADGTHLGGYIIPGSYMMQQALIQRTGQITLSGEYRFTGQPGRSTEECVYNGTTWAITAFINNLMQSVNRTSEHQYRCLITGGGAEVIMPLLAIEFQHEPMLVIEGIRLVGNS
jgi:type III pantothenate kinase